MSSSFSTSNRAHARRVISATSALAAMLLVMGCAGGGLLVEPLPVTANPSEQTEALALRIDQARQAKVDILSPTWFSKASASLTQARETRESGGAVQEILGYVASGNAQLDKAQKISKLSLNVLPSVLDAREAARTAGATSLGTAYAETEEDFLSLGRAIENDNISGAERRAPEVERSFRALELRAIKNSTAGEVRRLIAKAREADAERLVPRTLAATEKLNVALDAFITKNRYASDEIGARAATALFQAKRLVALTNQAAASSRMAPEDLALSEEALIASYAKELGLPSLSDRAFADQRSISVSAAGELRRDRDFVVGQTETLRKQAEGLNQRIADLEGQSMVERERVATLEADRRMNEMFNEVSAEFDPAEAEVYRQGQQLVIRLRGVQFPIGDYVLQPTSYPLLAKVQKAIRTFGQPAVVVEGHTDTTGSSEVNQHLSQQRAEAVAAYLVANNTLPPELVTAVGKGFDVPIASNNTDSGRALNRRIDVVIDSNVKGVAAAVSAGPSSGK